MQCKIGSRSDSNSILNIFESSGLTEIAKRREGKWVVRCNGCNEPITRKQALMHNVIYSLNKIWHREHFTCIRCNCLVGYDGRPFRKCHSNRNCPICIDCYMEEYHPKCNVCKKALRETCVKAMNKLWHRCCFTCTKCHSPFANGEFLILNEKPYDIDCYYLTKYENEFTPVITSQGGPNAEFSGTIDQKKVEPEKCTQKSQDTILQQQFRATNQSTEIKKNPPSTIPLSV
ncbi:LIM domain family protein [Acanthocheilonema viteae]